MEMELDDDSEILKRNRPGTTAEDFCQWPFQPLEEMDGPLAVQQYIQQLIRLDPLNINRILKLPKFLNENVWMYEHVRQFCLELNGLVVLLQRVCNPKICTQMTFNLSWKSLCASHKTLQQCTAIDYIRHTLDGSASILNSSQHFASRIDFKTSPSDKFTIVCKRLNRIFGHTFYYHKEVFDKFEQKSHLSIRFRQFIIKYSLMTKYNLILCDKEILPQ